jgi:hypothetical protein
VLAKETGAEWIQGREGKDTYDEIAAPETFDENTMGSTIMFYTERADEPIEYTPPDFARDFKDDPPDLLAKRTDPSDRRFMYWWIEYGGQEDIDPIDDNEMIRDELWAIVYGAWDYIKNSGDFPEEDVADLQLDWTGKIPGKRESRRFIGDYVLKERDVIEQTQFDDAVGHGGWSIDIHPPSGFYDDQGRGSEHWQPEGPYQIPYRSLYPKGSENLFLAGRHVSASHVAFGSLRVQKTLATLGQAVGAAAAVAIEHGATPRDITTDHVDTLKQILLREDQWVIGEENEDPTDIAREASVRASSTQPTTLREPDFERRLEDELGVHLSTDKRIESIRLLLSAESETELSVGVHGEKLPENYIPETLLKTVDVTVSRSEPTWIEVPIDVEPQDAQGIFVTLPENSDITVHGQERELTGVITATATRTETHHLVPEKYTREINWIPEEWVPCFELTPAPSLYAPDSVTDGYSRPYGLPRSWCSKTFDYSNENGGTVEPAREVWIALEWDTLQLISTVQMAFNTALNQSEMNISPMDSPVKSETVRNYRIEYKQDGKWVELTAITENYQRFRRHQFEPVETDEIRIVVDATNGAPWAEIFEIRAYGPDHWPPLQEV